VTLSLIRLCISIRLQTMPRRYSMRTKMGTLRVLRAKRGEER
jgi:hypothetical protein